jgi:hypothetical protein
VIQGSRHESDERLGLDSLRVLRVVPAPEFANWGRVIKSGQTSASHIQSADSPSPPATREPTVAGDARLDNAELRYLRAVVANPGHPSSEYPSLLKIGTHRAQAIRQRLVQLGYLRERAMTTATRGRSAIVLEPLESALRMCASGEGGTL